MPYYKTKVIAEIYCKKEEGTILDESITPWLNDDLKQMKDSLLEVRSGSDGVTCDWRAKVLPPTNTGEVTLPCVHRILISDLCFVAYAFGKEGGSGHYCPYCLMTKKQWTLRPADQPDVGLWTVDLLEEMADDNSKKGP